MVTAAAVIDVRADVPRAGDRFFVDTNVWRFFTYAKFTTGDAAQIAHLQKLAQAYSKYVQECVKVGATLYWSPLSYSELSSVIERAEHDIYKALLGNGKVGLKDFRLGGVERATVVAEMQTAWGQISALGKPLPTPTDDAALASAIELFEGRPLDGYDIFYVHAMNASSVMAVITDDIDFTHVPNLRVFTANEKAIRQAGFFPKVAKSR